MPSRFNQGVQEPDFRVRLRGLVATGNQVRNPVVNSTAFAEAGRAQAVAAIVEAAAMGRALEDVPYARSPNRCGVSPIFMALVIGAPVFVSRTGQRIAC
jgi:hypothetical protein